MLLRIKRIVNLFFRNPESTRRSVFLGRFISLNLKFFLCLRAVHVTALSSIVPLAHYAKRRDPTVSTDYRNPCSDWLLRLRGRDENSGRLLPAHCWLEAHDQNHGKGGIYQFTDSKAG